jgi:hypothetical protein
MSKTNPWLDESLYPDVEPPSEIRTLSDRVDFLARLCAAWDFGVLPEAATVKEIKRPEWREAVDACNLLTSPAYHLVRKWHGLSVKPYLGRKLGYIADDPNLRFV